MRIKITVVPLEKVGKIQLGMSRTALRQTMGSDFTEFRKSKFSRNTSDDYKYLHVFYNENNECNAVEVFSDCEITIAEFVLPRTVKEFNKWLLQQDSDAEITEFGATSKKLSIGMSAMENQVESILFGVTGYYCFGCH